MKTPTVIDHQGHKIRLTDDFRFIVSAGPMFKDASEYQRTFDSLVRAKDEIDKRTKAAMKQKKTGETLKLPVLDSKGVDASVHGIHSGTGRLLGIGDATSCYPAVPWVKEALDRRAKLVKERDEINERLRLVRIDSRRGYGRIDPDKYDGMIENLKKEHAASLAKARSLAATIEFGKGAAEAYKREVKS